MQKYTLSHNGCPECGHNEFILREKTTYQAGVTKDGTLESYDLYDYRIERIYCKSCKTTYSVDDFMDIDLGVW